MADQKNRQNSSDGVHPANRIPSKKKSKISILRISFLFCVALCVAGVFLWNAQTQSGCGCRAHSSYTKSNLHNVYLACKAYWYDNGSDSICTHEIAQLTAYGYVNTPNVELVAFGNESEFLGFAYNKKSPEVYKLNALGTVEKFSDSPMDALIFLSRAERGLVKNGETL